MEDSCEELQERPGSSPRVSVRQESKAGNRVCLRCALKAMWIRMSSVVIIPCCDVEAKIKVWRNDGRRKERWRKMLRV